MELHNVFWFSKASSHVNCDVAAIFAQGKRFVDPDVLVVFQCDFVDLELLQWYLNASSTPNTVGLSLGEASAKGADCRECVKVVHWVGGRFENRFTWHRRRNLSIDVLLSTRK